MLYALDKAQILSLLTEKAKSYKYLYKPEKIFLNNTNLMHALCRKVDVGNMRETFFQNQLSVSHATVSRYGCSGFCIDVFSSGSSSAWQEGLRKHVMPAYACAMAGIYAC